MIKSTCVGSKYTGFYLQYLLLLSASLGKFAETDKSNQFLGTAIGFKMGPLHSPLKKRIKTEQKLYVLVYS